MQQRLRELSLNSSLPLSPPPPPPSSPSPEELFSPKTRSLPRSSPLTQSPPPSASVHSRRSEPLPSRGHRRQRSLGIRESNSFGTSSSSDCAESIEDLVRHPKNPIRLKHWPLVEKAPTPDPARLIPLSAWPLSSSDVPDRSSAAAASVLLGRNWNCGNPYAPDPVTVRQHPNEDSAQSKVTTTTTGIQDRIQKESEEDASRTRRRENSHLLLRRSEYGPLNVINSSHSFSSSSSYHDRPLRNELTRSKSVSCPSSDDSLFPSDLFRLETHGQKQGSVGKRGGGGGGGGGGGESHMGLMSRFRLLKRSRRHDVTA